MQFLTVMFILQLLSLFMDQMHYKVVNDLNAPL
jgi:hypothetical protein